MPRLVAESDEPAPKILSLGFSEAENLDPGCTAAAFLREQLMERSEDNDCVCQAEQCEETL